MMGTIRAIDTWPTTSRLKCFNTAQATARKGCTLLNDIGSCVIKSNREEFQ